MGDNNNQESPFEVAIVGGGIVGLVLAKGLLRRQIKVTVYERTHAFREIGAGMAFTAQARYCMKQVDSAVADAFAASGAVSFTKGGEKGPNDCLRWLDGYNRPREEDPYFERPLCSIDAGYKGFEGCRRDQFLDELAKSLPSGVVYHGKELNYLEENKTTSRMKLTFSDGTTAEADVVIGCDGIKSRVRELMIGLDNPESRPHFTHKVAYRGLVPMDKAKGVLGDWKASNFHHHVGPNAHLTHYAVAGGTMLNVTAFLSDPGDWADYKQMVSQGSRKDVEDAFIDWNPCVLELVRLLPEELIKWGLFDLWDYPLPTYHRKKVCLAGDAAHASSPHHGTGACCGMEDALCLTVLLEQARDSIRQNGPRSTSKALNAALETYTAIRMTRTQWLVNSSRRVCDLYHQPEWADSAKWLKAETCFEEIRDRSYKLWFFDVDGMVKDAKEEYERKFKALGTEVVRSVM